MPLLIDTADEHGLPTADLLLFALPGVGECRRLHSVFALLVWSRQSFRFQHST